MTDHYKISLGILKQLLEKSDNSHWANWISEDIQLWESKKDVKHHLGAYGGMGSINDLFVGGTDKLGIWNNQVFDTIKNLSWNLAKQRIDSAPTTPEFYKYGNGQLSGWRCRNCGHSRLDENNIEQYLSFKYLPLLITDLISKNQLQNLLPVSHWIDAEEIESERIRIKDYLIKSEIEEQFDHKNLNIEVAEFKTLNPTAENISMVIWNKLRAKIEKELDLSITLYETPRNFVTYDGGL